MARAAAARPVKSEPNVNSLSIDELIALREEVSEALSEKVTEQRRSLESELAKLTRFQGRSPHAKPASGSDTRTPVAPKYRNPENPSETWAGRGLKPRWLTAAIASGKKVDDFLISNLTPPLKVAERKTIGKPRRERMGSDK